jgi:poly-gamma-glutamate synthesis protein (capsule biosynthesis protein)
MNLETSVTSSGTPDLGKPVNYRMSPANLDVLRVARVDVWALANNHVLDYGRPGLRETLAVLDAGGVRGCGAGATDVEAWRPLRVPRARVTVLSVADASSGVPPSWQAGPDRPGVALLPGLTDAAADAVAHRLQEEAEPGDVLVVSVHWGSNWGYAVPSDQRRFAHRLLDAGVHVVHGHSSHHPRPVEVHRGHLVLHGCGDLVDDYEGIGGYAAFRDDLRVLWVADVEAGTGALTGLRLVPLRARRLRLEHAAAEDVEWLRATLTREGRSLGTRVEPGDGGLALRW